MTRTLFATLPSIILGALIAAAPFTFARVCDMQDDMHMTCFYTARAELGIGVVIAALGLIGLFVAPKIRVGLSIAIAAVAALALAVPTVLIGVCPGGMMHCHMIALPTLIVLSVLAIVFALVAIGLDVKASR